MPLRYRYQGRNGKLFRPVVAVRDILLAFEMATIRLQNIIWEVHHDAWIHSEDRTHSAITRWCW